MTTEAKKGRDRAMTFDEMWKHQQGSIMLKEVSQGIEWKKVIAEYFFRHGTVLGEEKLEQQLAEKDAQYNFVVAGAQQYGKTIERLEKDLAKKADFCGAITLLEKEIDVLNNEAMSRIGIHAMLEKQIAEMNKNCISINLHESRMKALAADKDAEIKRKINIIAEIDKLFVKKDLELKASLFDRITTHEQTIAEKDLIISNSSDLKERNDTLIEYNHNLKDYIQDRDIEISDLQGRLMQKEQDLTIANQKLMTACDYLIGAKSLLDNGVLTEAIDTFLQSLDEKKESGT